MRKVLSVLLCVCFLLSFGAVLGLVTVAPFLRSLRSPRSAPARRFPAPVRRSMISVLRPDALPIIKDAAGSSPSASSL